MKLTALIGIPLLLLLLWMLAKFYRYEPIPLAAGEYNVIHVWDRWENRKCIVLGVGTHPLCTVDEINSAATNTTK